VSGVRSGNPHGQGTIRGGQFVGGFPGGAYEIHYEIEQEEGFVFLAGEIDLEKVD
jgi:hypothetical protein